MVGSIHTSRPLRARGLKLLRLYKKAPDLQSRPLRARGLKHEVGGLIGFGVPVAPPAGAWIETKNFDSISM